MIALIKFNETNFRTVFGGDDQKKVFHCLKTCTVVWSGIHSLAE